MGLLIQSVINNNTMKNIRKPEVITSSNNYYLGIVNQEINKIENGFEFNELNRRTLKNYIMAYNINSLSDFKISKNQEFITRELDIKETMLWESLVTEMIYVKKIAISKLENDYFDE